VVRVQDLRRSPKTITDWGKWESGKMPRSAFPLSKAKNRAYRLGSAFRWRVVVFTALDAVCRLLIAYNPNKEEYRAVLGLEGEKDTAILACFEFHGTHPGWHVLPACGDANQVPRGMMRGPWQRRMPRARQFHRRQSYRASDDNAALTIAADFFNLHKKEGALL
jgi:hypothetical protein